MIAAVHLDPRLTGPFAIVLAGLLVWYWMRLGQDDVPRSRRRLRRISVSFMIVALPNFVAGLSYIDPSVNARLYIVSWSVSILLMILIFFTACADGLLTMHLHRQAYLADVMRNRVKVKAEVDDDVGPDPVTPDPVTPGSGGSRVDPS